GEGRSRRGCEESVATSGARGGVANVPRETSALLRRESGSERWRRPAKKTEREKPGRPRTRPSTARGTEGLRRGLESALGIKEELPDETSWHRPFHAWKQRVSVAAQTAPSGPDGRGGPLGSGGSAAPQNGAGHPRAQTEGAGRSGAEGPRRPRTARATLGPRRKGRAAREQRVRDAAERRGPPSGPGGRGGPLGSGGSAAPQNGAGHPRAQAEGAGRSGAEGPRRPR